MVIDINSGAIQLQGRSGRRYSAEEYERALEKAEAGDAEARALLDDATLDDGYLGSIVHPRRWKRRKRRRRRR